ncbi:hypothetical protein OG21DRAFT_665631 [Imleria badia]|nr:hypothetical protein OG21DRAFT_665631 [Imleria badia]
MVMRGIYSGKPFKSARKSSTASPPKILILQRHPTQRHLPYAERDRGLHAPDLLGGQEWQGENHGDVCEDEYAVIVQPRRGISFCCS